MRLMTWRALSISPYHSLFLRGLLSSVCRVVLTLILVNIETARGVRGGLRVAAQFEIESKV